MKYLSIGNLNLRLTALTLAFLMLISSCETIINVELPPNEPKLVLNCNLNPVDTIKVSLTQSLGILDDSNIQPITDGAVILYENGNLIDTLTNQGNGIYTSDKTVTPGNSYTIAASASNYNTASGTTNIPLTVPINNCLVTDSLNAEYQLNTEIKFTLNDPTGKNYYSIELNQSEDTTSLPDTLNYYCSNGSSIYIYSNDGIFNNGASYGSKLTFTDELFEGKTVEISILLASGDFNCNPNAGLNLVLKSITKDYFLYDKTYSEQQQNGSNPFAEPVPVFNNITNGFGIIGASSSFVYKIR